MVRAFVLRGALAGAVGGILAFVFARIFAEPLIQAAIDYESGREAAQEALDAAAGKAAAAAGPDTVSRGVQANIGIGVGMVLIGLALGLLVAIVYSMVHGRVSLRPRVLAMLVAVGGFVTLYATPFVKYPANPPAVGHEQTIGDRTGLYLIMVIGSVVSAVAAVAVARRLRARLGSWNAVLAGIATYVVLCSVLMAILPSLGDLSANVAAYGPAATETPRPLLDPAGRIVFPGFDAELLYAFRFDSLTAQAILWATLGLIFGSLAERTVSHPESPRAQRDARRPAVGPVPGKVGSAVGSSGSG